MMTAAGPRLAKQEDDRASWANLHARERMIWWAGTSFVPVIALLLLALPLAVAPLSPRWIVVLSGVWLAVYLAASLCRQRFRCPRCGQRFFEHERHVDVCRSCHLPLGAGRAKEGGVKATRQ